MSHNDTENAMEEAVEALGLTAPRVTLDYINEMLEQRVTYRFDQPIGTTVTFCHAFLDDSFHLDTGFTKFVSMDNFDADLGREYAQINAKNKARNKLFELEGYRLYAQLNPDAYVGFPHE
jgi:hypothetical protein